MDLGAALLGLLTVGVVKVLVMAFSARLLLRVYRVNPAAPRKRPWLMVPAEAALEYRALRAALALFFVSEMTCGVEVYILAQSNAVTSAIHAFTSAFGMALFAVGVYLLLDRQVFRYADPTHHCAAKKLCQGCTITAPEGCRFRSTLFMVGTFVALAALAPLAAPTTRVWADARRWMLPFPSVNHWYDGALVPFLQSHVGPYAPNGMAYFYPDSMLLIEFRVLPVLAFCVAAASLALLRRGDERRAVPVLLFAVGMLAYVYFEVVLVRATGDLLIGSLFHEVAEFWFLLATAEFLRRCYPPRLPVVAG